MNQELIVLLKEVLSVVLLLVVPFLAKVVAKYLDRIGESIAQETGVETVAQLMKEISESVKTAVECTNQTYVDSIKNSDDPFTKKAQEEAFKKSYQTAVMLLSEDAKKYIEVTFESMEFYLTAKIEAEVQKQKLKKEEASAGKLDPILVETAVGITDEVTVEE